MTKETKILVYIWITRVLSILTVSLILLPVLTPWFGSYSDVLQQIGCVIGLIWFIFIPHVLRNRKGRTALRTLESEGRNPDGGKKQ